MRLFPVLCLLPASLLLACATPQASAKGAQTGEGVAYITEQKCVRESSGSHIPETVCRSQEQLEHERAQAQRLFVSTWGKPRVSRR